MLEHHRGAPSGKSRRLLPSAVFPFWSHAVRRLTAVFILCFSLLAPLAWARPIVIGFTPWVGNLLSDTADTRGYWKDAGVDVKMVRFEDYAPMLKAFQDRKIDLMYDMNGTFVDLYQSGVPLTIVAETDWSNGGDKVIVNQAFANDIQKIKQQTVGIYLSRVSVLFFLDRFLMKNGLTLNDIKLKEMEGEPLGVEFEKGKMPMMVNYDPPALHATRDGGAKQLASSADFPGVIPEGFAIHNEARKELGDESITRLLSGLIRASRWLGREAGWKDIQAILAKRTLVQSVALSDIEMASLYGSVRFHGYGELLARNQTGGGQMKYLSELREFMQRTKRLKRDFEPAKLFDNGPVTEALKRANK